MCLQLFCLFTYSFCTLQIPKIGQVLAPAEVPATHSKINLTQRNRFIFLYRLNAVWFCLQFLICYATKLKLFLKNLTRNCARKFNKIGKSFSLCIWKWPTGRAKAERHGLIRDRSRYALPSAARCHIYRREYCLSRKLWPCDGKYLVNTSQIILSRILNSAINIFFNPNNYAANSLPWNE